MTYLDFSNDRHLDLLSSQKIDPSNLKKTIIQFKQFNDRFYHSTKKNEHIYTMLSSGEMMLNGYLPYKNMPLKEKKEWETIKDLKTGDRGYVNRYLVMELEKIMPRLYREIIYPLYSIQVSENRIEAPELSDDINALLVTSNIPGCFRFLEKMGNYKKGVFNPLRRNYISFIENKILDTITQYLKSVENELDKLDLALFGNNHQTSWSFIEDIILKLCSRADPNHDDPISTEAINSLRSIYISLFNIAMIWLIERDQVPISFRRLLPAIPDRLDFSKEGLQDDNAWKRYQDHHFLFMRLPKDQKEKLTSCLGTLTAAQRVMWMGCLGKQEIQALVLPMVSQRGRFENLATAAFRLKDPGEEDSFFGSRVWSVLQTIYSKYFSGKDIVSNETHHLFGSAKQQNEAPVNPKIEIGHEGEETDFSYIRDLRFLVVDDSEKIRKMTITVLEKEGVNQIHEAADGEQAWEIINRQPLDIILCDWIMPNLTGIELVQRMMQVENLANNVAFLMLTTVNDKASIVEALSVGVRGYLIKPFSRKQLLEKVGFASKWLSKERLAGKVPVQTDPTQPAAF